MPRGIAAINRLWREHQEAAQRAEEEALRAQQEADALRAPWEDANSSPPAYEPDSQAAPKPSYGLLDLIPALRGDPPGYIRPRPAPVPFAHPLPQGVFDLLPAQWGRPGDSPFASGPDPWTAALAMMPPRLPAFGALQPALPGPRVPTTGGGPPVAIAGWPTSMLEGVSPQAWPDPSVSLLPIAPPLGQRAFESNPPSVPGSVSDDDPWAGGAPSDPRVLSDATPDNLWIPGAQYAAQPHGHHWFVQKYWKRIPREAIEVFDAVGIGKTGPLPIQTIPKAVPPGTGQPVGHWFDEAHRKYNDAVGELFEQYLEREKIKPEQMTAERARILLRQIAVSNDPRIQTYREVIHRIGRLYRLRSGIRGGAE